MALEKDPTTGATADAVKQFFVGNQHAHLEALEKFGLSYGTV